MLGTCGAYDTFGTYYNNCTYNILIKSITTNYPCRKRFRQGVVIFMRVSVVYVRFCDDGDNFENCIVVKA